MMIKSIIKRIIVAVAVTLIIMFLKKEHLLMEVQAKSLLTTKIAQEVYVFNNNQTAFTTTIDYPFFKNAGIGYLYFTFSTNKSSGNATDPISMIRSVAVTTGGVNYTCDIGTTSLSNSTYGGNIYSVRCPINIGSSGITNIIYHPTDIQTNSLSLYRFTNDGYFTFESDSSVQVNVDTSSTTTAINNQTNTITSNANNNTQSIINNQNQNTHDIIDSQQDLLGDKCKNIFNSSIMSGTYSSGVSYTVASDGKITQSASDGALWPDTYSKSFVLPAGTYTFSLIGASGQVFQVYNYNTSSSIHENSGTSFTYTFNVDTRIGLKTYGGGYPVSYYITIAKGTSPISYCQYGTATSKLDNTNNKLDNVNSSINNMNNTITNSNVGASNDLFSDFIEDFDPNTHGLTRIVLAPLQLVSSILDTTCTSFSIPLPFVNQNVVLPCMSTIYISKFPHFLVIYRLITDGIVSYWVSVNVFRKVKGFLDPTDDKVEVFDL